MAAITLLKTELNLHCCDAVKTGDSATAGGGGGRRSRLESARMHSKCTWNIVWGAGLSDQGLVSRGEKYHINAHENHQ